MKAFLDTSFIIAYLNRKEKDHIEADRLLERTRKQRMKKLYVSDFIYDEATALSLRRYGPRAVQDVESFFSATTLVQFLRVAPAEFDQARELFLKRIDTGLSLTDWTVVVQCQAQGIDTIFSFDRGFDAVFSRNNVPD